MTALRRTGRRVALLARYPDPDPSMPQRIPNLGMRMVEAHLRQSGLPGLDVRAWDLEPLAATPESVAAEVMRFDPDVVGFSAFLWSLPFFLDVAALLRADDPRRVIVFGGPSARPVMIDLPPHDRLRHCIDALVISEGEETFRDIIALPERSGARLLTLPGIAVHNGAAWQESAARPLADLNILASPYRMGLIHSGGLGIMQTYRGCPFTCAFCEWGVMESPKRVRDIEGIAEEFNGMARLGLRALLLADAGLNLNRNAFQNLRAAQDATGFLSRRGLICEIYPAKVQDEHLAFLRQIGNAYVGVGLQSFDSKVLAHVDRKYDEARFEQTLQNIAEVAYVTIEIILGLPGDSPDRFRLNFERARALPCGLRVYHCVVLPSGLMVRSPPEHALDFDPVTLKMLSCLGWTAQALEAETAFLSREAAASGGASGRFFWNFPPPQTAARLRA